MFQSSECNTLARPINALYRDMVNRPLHVGCMSQCHILFIAVIMTFSCQCFCLHDTVSFDNL